MEPTGRKAGHGGLEDTPAPGGSDPAAGLDPSSLGLALDQAILAGQAFGTIGRMLSHRLHLALDCSSVRVLRLDHDSRVAQTVGTFPHPRVWDSDGRLIPFESFETTLAALAAQPVLVIEDLRTDAPPDRLLWTLRDEGERGCLLAAVMHEGWVDAVLVLTWSEDGVPRAAKRLVEQLAQRLAVVLRIERLQQWSETLRLELLAHSSERGHEVRRARRLAVELGRIAGSLDATRGVDTLVAELAERLRGLGLGIVVAQSVPSGALRVSCTSFRPAILAAVERALGLPLIGLRVPSMSWTGELDGELPRAYRGSATTNMVSQLLPTVDRRLLDELLQVVGFDAGTPFLVVPIQGRRGEAGFLVAWGVSFLDDIKRELAVFGVQLGAVLEAARWGARERRRRARLEALRTVLADVELRGELPGPLDDLLAGAMELLEAEHGLLALTTDSGLELEVASVIGFGGPEPGDMLIAAEDVVSEVVRSRIPIAVRDYQRWPGRLESPEPVAWHGVLAVPLLARGWLSGVLLLARSTDFHPFSKSDTGLLEAFGQHAALVIENARLIQRLREAMSTDALTGLANRRELFARGMLELARAERFSLPLSAVMLDLDHFKRLNDEHGHAAGDAALRTVGAAILETCRSIDLCARYGGEEFALLLPGTPLEGARLLGERVRDAIATQTTAASDVPVRVTASVGVAQVQPGEELEALLARADAALLVAKRGGRDRVVVAGGPIG